MVIVWAEGKGLAIKGSGTGAGTAAEKLSLIWERFYQGEQYAQHQEKGARLGLSPVFY